MKVNKGNFIKWMHYEGIDKTFEGEIVEVKEKILVVQVGNIQGEIFKKDILIIEKQTVDIKVAQAIYIN